MSQQEGTSRRDVELRLIQRSFQDESFRQRILQDPRSAVEEELGARLPQGINVRAVEETPDTIYVVLPSRSRSGQTGELSDQDLDAVAGGGGTWETCGQELTCWCVTTTTCNNAHTVYGNCS